MDRRRFLAGVGAGFAVGVAGCADAGTDGPFDDADWRDGDGLDVTVLAERHTETLVDAGGVTLFSTAETSHDGEEQPNPWLPSQEYESRYDLENGRQYVRQEIPDDGEPEVSELFIAGDEALFRQRIGDRVQYDRQPIDLTDSRLVETMRSEVVTGIRVEGETTADETEYEGLNMWNLTSDGEGSVRGESTARFVADTFDGDRTIPSTIETASATVHVLESGVVPQIDQSWEGDHDGQTVAVDIGIDYRDPGAEIPEPEWLEDAREATSTEDA